VTVVPTALKVCVALRYLLTDPWASQAWQEVRGHDPWLLAERGISHMKGGQYYGKTKPERCYATEADAVKVGCPRSKR
jgi:hypothetical protein